MAKPAVETLEPAHGRSVVHRDWKPANVRIGRNGVVEMLDFGSALRRRIRRLWMFRRLAE